MPKLLKAPARPPQAHGCQPVSNRCPQSPRQARNTVRKTPPDTCIQKTVLRLPRVRAAIRATKSALPQARAVRTPRKTPMRLLTLVLLDLEAQFSHDLLQILPHFAFSAGIAQQVGRMVGGQQLVPP